MKKIRISPREGCSFLRISSTKHRTKVLSVFAFVTDAINTEREWIPDGNKTARSGRPYFSSTDFVSLFFFLHCFWRENPFSIFTFRNCYTFVLPEGPIVIISLLNILAVFSTFCFPLVAQICFSLTRARARAPMAFSHIFPAKVNLIVA